MICCLHRMCAQQMRALGPRPICKYQISSHLKYWVKLNRSVWERHREWEKVINKKLTCCLSMSTLYWMSEKKNPSWVWESAQSFIRNNAQSPPQTQKCLIYMQRLRAVINIDPSWRSAPKIILHRQCRQGETLKSKTVAVGPGHKRSSREENREKTCQIWICF